MKMHENQRFFRKSKSLTCPPSLPSTDHTNIGKNQAQTCSAVAMSRRSAELKAGNQRFSPKSPQNTSKSPLTGRHITTSTKGKCMKMHENQRFFRKSKSLTCPPSLPSTDHTNIGKNQAQTCSAVAMSRRSAELKAGNQRFSPKSPQNTSKSPLTGRHMGPALTDRTGIGKNLSHTCIGKQH